MALLKFLVYILIIVFPLLEIAKINFANSISVSLNDLITGLIAINVFVLWIKGKIKISGKISKAILYFSLVCLISLIINIFNYSINNIFSSALYLIRWISYACLYFAVLNFSVVTKKRITKLLLTSGFMVLLISYLQYIFYQDLGNLFYLNWDKHLYRLFGTFFDPNFAGAFFAMLAVYTSYFLIKSNDFKNKTLYAMIVVFLIIAIVLTYSRSAILMLFFSFTVLLFLLKRTKYILVFITILLLAIFMSPRAFQSEGTNFFRSYSSFERVKSSKIAIEIFVKNPILGTGFNTYRYAQYKYGYLKGNKWMTTHSGSGTDNSYLFVLATTGIVGLVTYLYLLKRIYSALLHKKSNSKKDNLWKAISLAIFTGLLINSLFINTLFYPPIMAWFWMIFAITESS